MLAEYHQTIKSYKEQKLQILTNDDDRSNNKKTNDIPSLQTTTLNKAEKDSLENDFINSLKTSQLSGIEGKNLITLFRKIISAHNKSNCLIQTSLQETKQLNESYKDLVERLESEIKQKKAEEEQKKCIIDHLKAECEQLQVDLQKSQHNFDVAQEQIKNEKQLMKEKNEKEMDIFLSRMEDEVENLKSSMNDETTKMLENMKSRLQKEKDSEIKDLNEKILQQQELILTYEDQINFRDEEASSKHEHLKKRIVEMKKNSKEMEEKYKSIDKLCQDQERKISNLQRIHEEECKEWKSKFDIQSQKQEKELALIESKVKQIINSKECKIKALTKQLQDSEMREKKLENFIERMENGLPEL